MLTWETVETVLKGVLWGAYLAGWAMYQPLAGFPKSFSLGDFKKVAEKWN